LASRLQRDSERRKQVFRSVDFDRTACCAGDPFLIYTWDGESPTVHGVVPFQGRSRVASQTAVKGRDVWSAFSAWSTAADKAKRKVRWTYRVHDARRTFGYSAIKTSRAEH
jgi:hypothetical protein